MKLIEFQRHSSTLTIKCLRTWALFIIIVTALQSHGTSAAVHYGNASIYSLTRAPVPDSGTNATGSGNGSTIFLSDYDPVFSILVPLVPGKSFANESETARYFKDFYQGEFKVKAPQGFGIIAVIQILRLFTATGQSGQCLDFIRFREDATDTTPLKISQKICGKDDEDDFSLHPKNVVGDINFIAESGSLTVELVIVSTLLKSKWQPGKNKVEVVIAVEISFTAYPLKATISEKSTINSNLNNTNNLECFLEDELKTSETSQNIVWRPCTGAKALNEINNADALFCINEHLFCDGLIQCGFRDQFAQDENSCFPNNQNDADDLKKLEMILQTLHLNDKIINGSRLNPTLVKAQRPPLEVEIIQYFIIAVSVAMAIVFGLCFLYWLKRSHRNLCMRRVEVVGDVVDVSANGSNGIWHTEAEKYMHRQSIVVMKLDRVLNEYRHGRGSLGNNRTDNGNLNGRADSKL